MRTFLLYIITLVSITTSYGQQQIATLKSDEILVMNDSIQLPGTLTYNPNLKTQPLVIFVPGSGNVDRNGNQAMMNSNANYIKMLNDSLAQKEIAFYRFDKRSATASNIKFMMDDMNFENFINDVNLIVDYFKNDERFSSITLIGHSQGSLVAMLADHTHVDKYVSLAGTSDSFDTIITRQIQTQNGDSLATIVRSHFKELSETGTINKVDPNLVALFNKPTQPFLLSYMKYVPSEEIKKVNIPTLILNGTKDLQVLVADAERLHNEKPDSKLVIIGNMNHVLKSIYNDNDNMKSYNSPDFPLSKRLLSVLEEFIKE